MLKIKSLKTDVKFVDAGWEKVVTFMIDDKRFKSVYFKTQFRVCKNGSSQISKIEVSTKKEVWESMKDDASARWDRVKMNQYIEKDINQTYAKKIIRVQIEKKLSLKMLLG